MSRGLRCAGVLSRALSLGVLRVPAGGLWSPRTWRGAIEWHDWQTQPGADGDAVGLSTGLIQGMQYVQAVSTAKPTLKAAGINGRRAIRFVTDDCMTCDAQAAYVSGDDVAFTLAGVVQMDDLGASQYIDSFGSSSSLTKFHAIKKTPANALDVTREAADAQVEAIGSNPGTNAFAFVQQFTGTTVTLYTGTAMQKNIDAGSLDRAALALDLATIGCLRRSGTNSAFLSGYWGERVLVAGVSALSDIQNFMYYAAARWGTP